MKRKTRMIALASMFTVFFVLVGCSGGDKNDTAENTDENSEEVKTVYETHTESLKDNVSDIETKEKPESPGRVSTVSSTKVTKSTNESTVAVITEETETVFDTDNIIYSETGIGNLREEDLPTKPVSQDGFYNTDMKGIYLAGSDEDSKTDIYILQNYDNGGTEISGVLAKIDGDYAYYNDWSYTADLQRLKVEITSTDYNDDDKTDIIIAMTSDDGENLYIIDGGTLSCNRFTAKDCRDLISALLSSDYTYDDEAGTVTVKAIDGESMTYTVGDGFTGVDTSLNKFTYVLSNGKIDVYADINELQSGERIGGIYVELTYGDGVFGTAEGTFRFCT